MAKSKLTEIHQILTGKGPKPSDPTGSKSQEFVKIEKNTKEALDQDKDQHKESLEQLKELNQGVSSLAKALNPAASIIPSKPGQSGADSGQSDKASSPIDSILGFGENNSGVKEAIAAGNEKSAEQQSAVKGTLEETNVILQGILQGVNGQLNFQKKDSNKVKFGEGKDGGGMLGKLMGKDGIGKHFGDLSKHLGALKGLTGGGGLGGLAKNLLTNPAALGAAKTAALGAGKAVLGVASKAFLPVALGVGALGAVLGGVKGWKDAASISGKRKEDVTFADKIKATVAGALSGILNIFTFGLAGKIGLNAKNIFKGIEKAAEIIFFIPKQIIKIGQWLGGKIMGIFKGPESIPEKILMLMTLPGQALFKLAAIIPRFIFSKLAGIFPSLSVIPKTLKKVAGGLLGKIPLVGNALKKAFGLSDGAEEEQAANEAALKGGAKGALSAARDWAASLASGIPFIGGWLQRKITGKSEQELAEAPKSGTMGTIGKMLASNLLLAVPLVGPILKMMMMGKAVLQADPDSGIGKIRDKIKGIVASAASKIPLLGGKLASWIGGGSVAEEQAQGAPEESFASRIKSALLSPALKIAKGIPFIGGKIMKWLKGSKTEEQNQAIQGAVGDPAEMMKKIGGQMLEGAKKLLGFYAKAIKGVFKAITFVPRKIISLAKEIVPKILDFAKEAIPSIFSAFKSIVSLPGKIIGSILSKVKSLFSMIPDGIKDAVLKIAGKIPFVGGKIRSYFSKLAESDSQESASEPKSAQAADPEASKSDGSDAVLPLALLARSSNQIQEKTLQAIQALAEILKNQTPQVSIQGAQQFRLA